MCEHRDASIEYTHFCRQKIHFQLILCSLAADLDHMPMAANDWRVLYYVST